VKTRHWLGLAFVIRLIATQTRLQWHHPDEWFQTVEFADFLAFGVASQTNEFVLHMRNLTFPAMLAGPLKLANWLFSGDVAARMTAIKGLVAALDCVSLFAIARLMDRERWSRGWRNAGWALFVLCPFLVDESVRPSQEHLSAIAFWCALGFLAMEDSDNRCRKRLAATGLAGVALALTGAFRYPSVLLSLGAITAVTARTWIAAHSCREPGGKRGLFPLSIGLFLGLLLGGVLGGVSDWLVYGRPYESFWMYFQYNVLTGLSSSLFGSQPATVYFDYFKGPFGTSFIPIGIACIFLVPLGLARGLKRLEPWAWGMAAYLIGHLLISHKEPRFMAPLLGLTLWAALQGARALAERWPRLARQTYRFRPLRTAVFFWFTINALFLLRSLWGDTWRTLPNYLNVTAHAKDLSAPPFNERFCAAVTVQKPAGFILPPFPLGYFPAPAHEDSSPHLASKPLVWVDRAAACAPQDRVLLQPQRTEIFWEKTAQCALLPSGPMHVTPESAWPWLIARNYVAAPWYDCPAAVLALFVRPETRHVLSRRMVRLPELPPPGIDADEFLRRGWKGVDAKDPVQFSDGTMGDL
jgi:hypothetical protein